MSKVTQITSNRKDLNVNILSSKISLATHGRTLKGYLPPYLAHSRHTIENITWHISESEGPKIGLVLIKGRVHWSQNATYYKNKLLARPERNQRGPHED